MTLTKFKPAKSLLTDRFFPTGFDALFHDLIADTGASTMEHFMAPKSEVLENDNAFLINVQLPGMSREDVKVDVKEHELSIVAESKTEKEEKSDRYHLREFKSGKFKRNFYLPKMANIEAIKAEMKNGILEIEIPKMEKAKAKEISIK